jgi:hypothetical protein
MHSIPILMPVQVRACRDGLTFTSGSRRPVNERAKAKISPATIRKEVATLRAAWNWGEPMELTAGRFPSRPEFQLHLINGYRQKEHSLPNSQAQFRLLMFKM